MASQNSTAQRTGAARRGQARAAASVSTREKMPEELGETTTTQPEAASAQAGRALTVTVPLDRAIDIVMLPVAAARRVLSAKNVGLPVYVGLGVLAVADVIDPPVAAALGVGYAVLRRWGPLRPAREAPDGQKERSSSSSGEE
jgi:hypothetical protein